MITDAKRIVYESVAFETLEQAQKWIPERCAGSIRTRDVSQISNIIDRYLKKNHLRQDGPIVSYRVSVTCDKPFWWIDSLAMAAIGSGIVAALGIVLGWIIDGFGRPNAH